MTNTEAERTHAIVVGVDYSELGDLALERALELGRANERTQLHIVHADPGASPGSYGFEAESVTDLAEVSKQLNLHVERAVQRWSASNPGRPPFERLTTHVRAGNPAEAIAQLASDVMAELVVVGTHGRRGARRFLLGSVAEVTVRLAPCAVLVVRPPDASVPAIEPPCPRCVEARRASNGKDLWCEQHREHHDRRHTHHYSAGTGDRQSGFLIHTH